MSQDIEAVYRSGNLVPLTPLLLQEEEHVRLRVERLESDQRQPAHDQDERSVYDALVQSGLLGVLENAPSDLSTNPVHLEGLGESDCDSR